MSILKKDDLKVVTWSPYGGGGGMQAKASKIVILC